MNNNSKQIGSQYSFLDYQNSEIQQILINKKLSPIDPQYASDIRDNFNRFFLPPRIVNQDGQGIRGFTFSREDFEMAAYGRTLTKEELANINPDTPDTPLAKHLHVSFGYHDGSVDPKLNGFTTVLYGVTEKEIDQSDPPKVELELIHITNRVRDYSKPCPDNCPIGAK